MHSAVDTTAQCPPVHHKLVLHGNSWMDGAIFSAQRPPSAYPALYCKGNCVSVQIRIFPSGILSKTHNFLFRHGTSVAVSVVDLVQTALSLSHWASTFVYNALAATQCVVLFVCNNWDLYIILSNNFNVAVTAVNMVEDDREKESAKIILIVSDTLRPVVKLVSFTSLVQRRVAGLTPQRWTWRTTAEILDLLRITERTLESSSPSLSPSPLSTVWKKTVPS